MVKRFLLYSLAHNRPVRVLLSETMKYKNITVIALDEEKVSFLSAGRKNPQTLPLEGLLSASYARGDTGDTLQYTGVKKENEQNP